MAYTSPEKTFSVSELANAEMLNIYQRDNMRASVHRIVQKLADQSINNSTTLTNDTELFVEMGTNEVYYFRVFLELTNTVDTPHTQVAFTVPSGATICMATYALDTGGFYNYLFWRSSGVPFSFYGPLVSHIRRLYEFEGFVTTASTAGKFQVQWAQSVAAASNVHTVKDTSSIWGCKLV